MKRIGTIDLLKFVLAVVIVLHHYQQVTGVRFSGWNFYGGTIYFGYAVEFFFIIYSRNFKLFFQYISLILKI